MSQIKPLAPLLSKTANPIGMREIRNATKVLHSKLDLTVVNPSQNPITPSEIILMRILFRSLMVDDST